MTTTTSDMDWQCGKSLSDCFEYIFTSSIASDVTFLVGEHKKMVQSHKLILISRSPVFYAMLEGPLAEKGEITIPDIEAEAFEIFLRYLYTDKVTLTFDNIIGVLNAARKYCCDTLLAVCEQFWQKNISTENACTLLEKAHDHEEDALKDICMKAITGSFETTASMDTFNELCSDCVASIVESDDLTVKESIVYTATSQWAEAECVRQKKEVNGKNKRKCLENIIHSIRFPVMEEDFFLDQVCMEELLSAEEILEIIKYKRNKDKEFSTVFNAKKRRSSPHPSFGVLPSFGLPNRGAQQIDSTSTTKLPSKFSF